MFSLMKTHKKKCLLALVVFLLFLLLLVRVSHVSTSTQPINDDDDLSNSLPTNPSKTSPDDDGCSDRWPDFELFLTAPQSSLGFFEFKNWFLPSLALFWPLEPILKLLIVTDVDDEFNGKGNFRQVEDFRDEAQFLMNGSIQIQWAKTRRLFETKRTGWDKSQWLKFWADNFTNAEYVGFVDTDTVFVSRLTKRDFFDEKNKPIVRPMYGKPRKGWVGKWHLIPEQTFLSTGSKEAFNCMTYFPIIVKTAHLKTIRQIIMNNLGFKYFDQSFTDFFIERGHYSEYNIICNSLWWHFRDEYRWFVDETEVGWHGEAPVGQVADMNEAKIQRDVHLQNGSPRISVHWTFFKNMKEKDTYKNVMRKGYCYSLTEGEQRAEFCNEYPDRWQQLNENEYTFEHDNFDKRRFSMKGHLERITRNEICPHKWNLKGLKLII